MQIASLADNQGKEAQAVAALTEQISELTKVCAQLASGQKEVAEALDRGSSRGDAPPMVTVEEATTLGGSRACSFLGGDSGRRATAPDWEP